MLLCSLINTIGSVFVNHTVTLALKRSERRPICPSRRGIRERAKDKSVLQDVFRCVRSTVDREYRRRLRRRDEN